MVNQIVHSEADARLCGSTRAAELLEVSLPTLTRLVQSHALIPVQLDEERGPRVFRVEDVLALRAERSAS